MALDAAVNGSAAATRNWYARHLDREPSLVAAAKWIAGQGAGGVQVPTQVQKALDHAVKPLTPLPLRRVRVRSAAAAFWQCPGCQAWDSYPARRVEEL